MTNNEQYESKETTEMKGTPEELSNTVTEAPSKTAEQASRDPDLATLLEETQKKASEHWDLFLRTRADADNIRRRAVTDVENAHKYGIEKFAREILAVVDSLDQGLALSVGDEAKGLHEGMALTHKLLLDTLDKFGIKPLDPLGEMFDPMRHEALSTQVDNSKEPNRVLIVIQKGFSLHDRLLRPTRVIVSKAE